MEPPQVCVHTCAREFRSVCVFTFRVWAGLHPGMVSWGPMDVSPKGPKGSLSPLSAALSAPGPSVAPWGEAIAEHPSQRVCKTPNYRDDRSDPQPFRRVCHRYTADALPGSPGGDVSRHAGDRVRTASHTMAPGSISRL